MRPRNPAATRWPEAWLMTDERMDDALWPALRRLPPGAGVVFRHYATPAAERRCLLARVRRIATARRLCLVVAGDSPRGLARHGRCKGAFTAPAHDRREAEKAVARGARLLFVSPVYATRSHPGAQALGAMRAATIARGLAPAIALGGMDARRWRRIARLGFAGWAAIDAWVSPGDASGQKRNAVPT